MSEENETKNPAPEASDGGPPDALAELEKQLEQKTREASENYDRYVREVAEGENFKKRMQRDKADAIKYANESLIRDVLPVVDNLEWALAAAAGAKDESSIVEGVKLTLKLFKDTLERHGVSEVETAPGTAFDPTLHDAMGMEASAEVPPNSVLRVQQKGYKLRERLLRAARVTVAVRPEPAPGSAKPH
jgi:molecular chaperone GrpE